MSRNSPLRSALIAPLALAATLAGCSSSNTTKPTESTAAPQGDVAIAAPPGAARPATGAPSAPPAPVASASAAPVASASAAPVASAAPADTGALPQVKVANIGMHIGGGPNDNVTKEPIRRSVEPHFDAFRRCFALVADQHRSGDVGVDLRIPKDGGKAEVTKPRTALKGEGFTKCVVGVFEGIDFLKPKGGVTVVSYSLRFTP
jgi:hypothetical protein